MKFYIVLGLDELVEYIKKARRHGFRDDFVKKKLLDEGYSWRLVDDAFLNSGKPKRFDIRHRSRIDHDNSKTPMTILLNNWLKDALEKKAKEDGLTLYNEVKKILVNSISPSEIPKGVFHSSFIRKKLTNEEKERHSTSARKHQIRVDKERKKKVRLRRKEVRIRKRKEKSGF